MPGPKGIEHQHVRISAGKEKGGIMPSITILQTTIRIARRRGAGKVKKGELRGEIKRLSHSVEGKLPSGRGYPDERLPTKKNETWGGLPLRRGSGPGKRGALRPYRESTSLRTVPQ